MIFKFPVVLSYSSITNPDITLPTFSAPSNWTDLVKIAKRVKEQEEAFASTDGPLDPVAMQVTRVIASCPSLPVEFRVFDRESDEGPDHDLMSGVVQWALDAGDAIREQTGKGELDPIPVFVGTDTRPFVKHMAFSAAAKDSGIPLQFWYGSDTYHEIKDIVLGGGDRMGSALSLNQAASLMGIIPAYPDNPHAPLRVMQHHEFTAAALARLGFFDDLTDRISWLANSDIPAGVPRAAVNSA